LDGSSVSADGGGGDAAVLVDSDDGDDGDGDAAVADSGAAGVDDGAAVVVVVLGDAGVADGADADGADADFDVAAESAVEEVARDRCGESKSGGAMPRMRDAGGARRRRMASMVRCCVRLDVKIEVNDEK